MIILKTVLCYFINNFKSGNALYFISFPSQVFILTLIICISAHIYTHKHTHVGTHTLEISIHNLLFNRESFFLSHAWGIQFSIPLKCPISSYDNRGNWGSESDQSSVSANSSKSPRFKYGIFPQGLFQGCWDRVTWGLWLCITISLFKVKMNKIWNNTSYNHFLFLFIIQDSAFNHQEYVGNR